jgi:hypothetical protein
MNKKIVVTFPVCLKEFFFDNMENIKKTKKSQKFSGYEIISTRKNQNNLEIKIPCYIQGLNEKKQTYFVFLLPRQVLGKEKLPDPKTFFKKGLCRIEGVSNFNNCTILIFSGDYEVETTSLVGKINFYQPPHFGW